MKLIPTNPESQNTFHFFPLLYMGPHKRSETVYRFLKPRFKCDFLKWHGQVEFNNICRRFWRGSPLILVWHRKEFWRRLPGEIIRPLTSHLQTCLNIKFNKIFQRLAIKFRFIFLMKNKFEI